MIFLEFLASKKMFRKIFIFLVLFSPYTYLQDTNSWVIDDIRITGLQRVSAGSVFAVMPVGLGDEINKNILKKLLHLSLQQENLMTLN